MDLNESVNSRGQCKLIYTGGLTGIIVGVVQRIVLGHLLLYFLKDLFKQETRATSVCLSFCLHENSVHVPSSLKKRKQQPSKETSLRLQ